MPSLLPHATRWPTLKWKGLYRGMNARMQGSVEAILEGSLPHLLSVPTSA